MLLVLDVAVYLLWSWWYHARKFRELESAVRAAEALYQPAPEMNARLEWRVGKEKQGGEEYTVLRVTFTSFSNEGALSLPSPNALLLQAR